MGEEWPFQLRGRNIYPSLAMDLVRFDSDARVRITIRSVELYRDYFDITIHQLPYIFDSKGECSFGRLQFEDEK